MPQLDVTAWPPQLFWLAVTFIALYFIISKLVIPRTGGVIEGRKNQIDGDLAAAQSSRRRPTWRSPTYEKALAEARAKAHAHRAGDARQAQRRGRQGAPASSTASSPQQDRRGREDRSQRRADQGARRACSELATDIAADIVGQLTGTGVTKADAAEAVAKAQGTTDHVRHKLKPGSPSPSSCSWRC